MILVKNFRSNGTELYTFTHSRKVCSKTTEMFSKRKRIWTLSVSSWLKWHLFLKKECFSRWRKMSRMQLKTYIKIYFLYNPKMKEQKTIWMTAQFLKWQKRLRATDAMNFLMHISLKGLGSPLIKNGKRKLIFVNKWKASDPSHQVEYIELVPYDGTVLIR